jgi:hypothetical protein
MVGRELYDPPVCLSNPPELRRTSRTIHFSEGNRVGREKQVAVDASGGRGQRSVLVADRGRLELAYDGSR